VKDFIKIGDILPSASIQNNDPTEVFPICPQFNDYWIHIGLPKPKLLSKITQYCNIHNNKYTVKEVTYFTYERMERCKNDHNLVRMARSSILEDIKKGNQINDRVIQITTKWNHGCNKCNEINYIISYNRSMKPNNGSLTINNKKFNQ
jgi:hypothetical protein